MAPGALPAGWRSGRPPPAPPSTATRKVSGRGAPFYNLDAVTSQDGGKSTDLPENDDKIVRFKSENAKFHYQLLMPIPNQMIPG